MKVWIVLKSDFDSTWVERVFATPEAAAAFVEERPAESIDLDIEEWEVQP